MATARFEKPIFELERRLQDLKSHSTKHDVDLGSAVKELEVSFGKRAVMFTGV